MVAAVRSASREDLERIIEAEREIRDREASLNDKRREQEGYFSEVEEACLLHELELDPSHTVVDAGCGTGPHFPMLLAQASQVIGLDHSEEELKLAAGRLTRADAGRVDLIRCDLRDVPLDDGVADRVVCAEVIQHIPSAGYRLAALRELSRVLRPGGVVVIAAYRWHGHIRRHKEGFFGDLYYYAFTAREFGELMRAAGLQDVRVGGTGILPRASERFGVSADTQRRLAFTPVGRHLAHYVIGRGVKRAAATA
jgi:ubiquinone/menaquinone biosynthesis C-methylase UbiE